jgi:hypothetical protein
MVAGAARRRHRRHPAGAADRPCDDHLRDPEFGQGHAAPDRRPRWAKAAAGPGPAWCAGWPTRLADRAGLPLSSACLTDIDQPRSAPPGATPKMPPSPQRPACGTGCRCRRWRVMAQKPADIRPAAGCAAGCGQGVGQQAGDGHRADAARHRGDGAGHLGGALVMHVAHQPGLAVALDPVDAHVDHRRAGLDPVAGIISGRPTAATRMSAPAAGARPGPWCGECAIVTVQLSPSSSCAIGLPTMFERPDHHRIQPRKATRDGRAASSGSPAACRAPSTSARCPEGPRSRCGTRPHPWPDRWRLITRSASDAPAAAVAPGCRAPWGRAFSRSISASRSASDVSAASLMLEGGHADLDGRGLPLLRT